MSGHAKGSDKPFERGKLVGKALHFVDYGLSRGANLSRLLQFLSAKAAQSAERRRGSL